MGTHHCDFLYKAFFAEVNNKKNNPHPITVFIVRRSVTGQYLN